MITENLIPSAGFFPQYLAWARRLTDAPETYHLASALGVMSAVVSNQVDGHFDIRMPSGVVLPSIFPTNLWVLLVGPSGDRKSTAMEKAISCGQKVVGTISAISGSPEATFDLVVHKPDIFFYHSEGSTLFSQLQASYWLQGQGLLCDLYDGREDPPYVRMLKGIRSKKNPNPRPVAIVIRRPRISILIGISPDLLDATRRSDWTGGLIGRMLLIYGELVKPDENPPRSDEPGRLELEKYLAKIRVSLEEITRNNGGRGLQVGVRQDAMDVYREWVKSVTRSRKHAPPKIKTLFRRLPIHILRTSALYAVSQFHDTITLESMVPAIRFGDHSMKSIDRVGDLLADDPILRTAIRIRDMLDAEESGVVSVSRISAELRLSWSSISPAIQTLKLTGNAKVYLDAENPDLQWVQRVRPESGES